MVQAGFRSNSFHLSRNGSSDILVSSAAQDAFRRGAELGSGNVC
jgi:hypothetical protein